MISPAIFCNATDRILMNQHINFSVALRVGGRWLPVRTSGAAACAPFAATAERRGPLLRLRLRRTDGASFEADRIKVAVTLPLRNFAHVVVPDCGRHYVNISKALDIRAPLFHVCACNAGYPFMAVADEGGNFLAAFGIVSPTGTTEIRRTLPRISRRKAMVGGDQLLGHEIVWGRSAEATAEIVLDLYLQESAPTWHHALQEYTRAILDAENIVLPAHPGALLPVWCTWTAFCSSDMTDRRVLDNARIARDMGIGSVILDDGWFGAGLDDDAGEVMLGDYRPDPHKFPDLRRHVDELHALGLNVLLWHAPLCVAPASRAYHELRHLLIHDEAGEFISVNGLAQLCPASPAVRRYVAEETIRLMRSTGVDGLKVDLFNCLPAGLCVSSEHDHDPAEPLAALEAVMAAQWEAMRRVRPDALCELKQDYGNVRLARYGTMVRAGDTAYDVDTNCRRCFHTSACVPRVHNDYFVTSDLATPDAIALAMIRMLAAGVPTFGSDLVAMPVAHRRVIGHWLAFYREHLAMFGAPREPQTNDMSCWQGGDAAAAWVAALWQCREIRLPTAACIHVLNGTAQPHLYLHLPATRHATVAVQPLPGVDGPTRRLTLRDGDRLAVPSGGIATIMVTA
jgi:hypothetical protein